MLSSCLKLFLGLSLFIILAECIPKNPKECYSDADCSEFSCQCTGFHGNSCTQKTCVGSLIIDTSDSQEDEVNNTTDLTEDGENGKDENDEVDTIDLACRARNCKEVTTNSIFKDCTKLKATRCIRK